MLPVTVLKVQTPLVASVTTNKMSNAGVRVYESSEMAKKSKQKSKTKDQTNVSVPLGQEIGEKVRAEVVKCKLKRKLSLVNVPDLNDETSFSTLATEESKCSQNHQIRTKK